MAAGIAMLEDAYARVKALVDEGMSGADILAANLLADYDADYSWSFITTQRMTETFIRHFKDN